MLTLTLTEADAELLHDLLNRELAEQRRTVAVHEHDALPARFIESLRDRQRQIEALIARLDA